MEQVKSRPWIPTIFCCSFWILLIFVYYDILGMNKSAETIQALQESMDIKSALTVKGSESFSSVSFDSCKGRHVFVHDLPSRFNEDILKDVCKFKKELFPDLCKFLVNDALGPRMNNSDRVFSDRGWFHTNQFTVEVIFRNRMKKYECLTKNSSLASVIYVPFFPGFDIFRYFWYNISTRDATSKALMEWLQSKREWKRNKGKDHFLVSGRIPWDFWRLTDNETAWGNNLLLQPAMKNMTMLLLESNPWNPSLVAIPYPTYFHPAKDSDVIEWQQRMRKMERPFLFSFAGAPRPDKRESIRSQLMDQCRESKFAKLLVCGVEDFHSQCHNPSTVMRLFQRSLFCLQPQGDTPTRRSFFDSILAGCIPVLFHPESAYTQYVWYLPKNYSTYSVFIPEEEIKKNVSIEARLKEIPSSEISLMRERVIKLIPSVVYAQSKLGNLKDAFDIAVESMIKRVKSMRN
eukprot:TRINITY_DN12786_c0_g1_i1.p1 TRINITY_DN12786_c0_g1~~TRINITY_DN12786_c0_g1_i1.p1  ORF type:complete len:461 (-),score=19.36 TRINITY_DN12786_c0_g1_i1:144-1526(-)